MSAHSDVDIDDCELLDRIEDAIRRGGYAVGRDDEDGQRHGFMAELLEDGGAAVIAWAHHEHCCGGADGDRFRGIPNVVRWQGGWDCFEQCSNCGRMGVEAPWIVIEPEDSDSDIDAALAECSRPRNTFWYRDDALAYAEEEGHTIIPDPAPGDDDYEADEGAD